MGGIAGLLFEWLGSSLYKLSMKVRNKPIIPFKDLDDYEKIVYGFMSRVLGLLVILGIAVLIKVLIE